MTTLSVITLFPENKKQLAEFNRQLKNELINGLINPLEFLARMKVIEKVVEYALKDAEIDELIIDEASKYHKQELSDFMGFKMEIRETGTRYDYSTCNDTILDDLERKKKLLDEQIKNRQKMLQSLSGEIYNEDGVMLQKPVKSSKTKVVATLKA